MQPVLEYIYFEEETPTETFCALYFSETKCDPVATLEQWEVEVDQDYPPTETPVAPEASSTRYSMWYLLLYTWYNC